jgi:murein DD-endopeptidase MepM/ murein hydrolase activator NlpD
MTTSAAQLANSKSLTCPACNGPAEVKSRHVAVDGTSVRVYCSAECLRAKTPKAPETVPFVLDEPRARRGGWWLTGAFALGAACFAVYYAGANDETAVVNETFWLPPPRPVIAVEPVRAQPPPPPPPIDPQREEEQALLEELARDAWIHPLAGPARRMPINHYGAFGAAREGERPPECFSGHCGVDIGRVWGEPVLAVHAGVVEWVNRGPNEDQGGIFVKIAHRDGTLFSWYFHLAAVPRSIQRGAVVRAGQIIGLIGDTGVKQPVPHLHFSLSVKSSKTGRERFLDPEPLIAIWPLWIPGESDRGKLSTETAAGIPVRKQHPYKRRTAKPPPAADAAPPPAPPPADVTAAESEAPAP